jgi:hypothetical protein
MNQHKQMHTDELLQLGCAPIILLVENLLKGLFSEDILVLLHYLNESVIGFFQVTLFEDDRVYLG